MKVKSSLTSFNIESKDGVAIPVNDVAEPIMIYVVNPSKPEPAEGEEKKEEDIVSMSVNPDNSQVSYHTEYIRNESFLALFGVQQYGRKLTVRLKKNKKPTSKLYNYEFNLPDNSSCAWKNVTQYGNASIDIFTDWPEKVICKQNPWSVFISDSEELDGKFIIGKCDFLIIQHTIY